MPKKKAAKKSRTKRKKRARPRLIQSTRQSEEKQLLDSAAMTFMHACTMGQASINKIAVPGFMAREAYDAAEALLAERQRRLLSKD